jgi:hypothetical protein
MRRAVRFDVARLYRARRQVNAAGRGELATGVASAYGAAVVSTANATFREPVMRLRLLAASATILMATSTLATAQDTVIAPAAPVGGPQPGIEVPSRYASPGDSQQLLNPAPAAGATGATAPTRRGVSSADYLRQRAAAAAEANAEGGEGAEGAEVAEPWVTEAINGISTSSAQSQIVGASIYTGITPSFTDTLPHVEQYARRATSGSNALTWIGFQPLPDRTRVFLQTGSPITPTISESPDGRVLTVRLESTSITLSNFTRDVDASFFDRAVTHIRGRRSGNATEVSIELSGSVEYQVVSDSANPDYIYIDFMESGTGR